MTTENIKEKAEKAQRVFVENLPKPKKWWQESAIILSILALLVSGYSAHLSRKEFIAAHRPYVYVVDRKNSDGTIDVQSILLYCLNAPAKIIDQNFCYVVFEPNLNGKEKVIKTIPWTSLSITNTLYPASGGQQIFCKHDFKKEILEKHPKVILKRKVKIDYKALSGNRIYYFEGSWVYNKEYSVWDIDNLFGN
ncbi:MAG: hypothetical protein ACYC3B_09345 [Sedimentisphaerales bacterium]